ncbi:MAG: hypothetical protein JNM79_05765 [Burkholderiales bacterium]|nr:hypothetical protein [Burkholderiales bacterium]
MIFALGAALALGVRAMAVWLNRNWFLQGFAGDSSIHFAMIRQLSKDPRSRYVEQYVIDDEPISYPLGFHRFARLFPLHVVRTRPWLPNLVIFALFSGVFFAYLHYIERELLGRDGWAVLAIGATLFLLSTSNLIFDGPAIAYVKLSERLLARMACAAHMLFLVAGMIWNDPLSLCLAAAAGALALISSIFARQAMVFTIPLLALFLWSATPLWVLAASVVLAFAISRDHLYRGLRHTVIQWKLYKTLTKPAKWVRSMLSTFVSLKELRATGTLRRAVWTMIHREPVRLFAFFPELVLLVAFALCSAPLDGLRLFLLAPVLATLIVYVLTSTEAFNHLGESYRYLEYNLYFLFPVSIALLAGHVASDLRNLGIALYVMQTLAMWLVFQFIAIPHLRIWPKTDVLAEFIAAARLPDNAVVFPVSIGTGADLCARSTCRSFWYQPGVISTKLYEDYFEEFPFLKRDYRGLFKRHGVTHVICSKITLNIMDTWTYDFSPLEKIHESDDYVAYSVPPDMRAQ